MKGCSMVHIVGAGPGATDLITVRGARLLKEADVIIYAGSLVNKELLELAKEGAEVYDSARMTLEEVMAVIKRAWKEKKEILRLHTGDPCIYGAIREQMDAMDKEKIPYEICPGVSSFCGAASSLGMEYTLPGISQSVIITRMAGRTPVPDRESIASFAVHQTSMVLFLSAGMLRELSAELIKGGYPAAGISSLPSIRLAEDPQATITRSPIPAPMVSITTMLSPALVPPMTSAKRSLYPLRRSDFRVAQIFPVSLAVTIPPLPPFLSVEFLPGPLLPKPYPQRLPA